MAIFTYTPVNYAHKEYFWKELESYCLTITIPFLIIEDLNRISCSEDKLGGAMPNFERFRTIRNFMDNTNTNDVPFIGNRYTWRKKWRV